MSAGPGVGTENIYVKSNVIIIVNFGTSIVPVSNSHKEVIPVYQIKLTF